MEEESYDFYVFWSGFKLFSLTFFYLEAMESLREEVKKVEKKWEWSGNEV